MNPRMLERMRRSCRLAAECLTMVGDNIAPGITTEEINTLVHEWIEAHEGYPSPLNYGNPPFPKSVCTSVNDCVCHGIPSPDQKLEDGDIINVDVTGYFPKEYGFHGDTSATFYVGEPSEEAKKVVETARWSLELGIRAVKEGARVRDIGKAIQEYAESVGCSVVRDFVGHGVGREFHMPPQIPHYYEPRAGKRLRRGMVFTIEPMINLGDYRTEILDDHWTVLTRDRKLSAQFEHTLAVTRDGVEVLTRRPRPLKNSEDKPWSKVGELSSPACFEGDAVAAGE
ncbi:MAG TPA: type I methionyl aminopeptidase [Sandaracinaceae bacterium LLY-WYZ-13_1]|nr:type I methionyl aminopeptidase [Sandaracinaceae bacterium LLY-WYZ-13_1]